MPLFWPASDDTCVQFFLLVLPLNVNVKNLESGTILFLNKGCKSAIAHKVTPVKFNASVGFSFWCLLRLPEESVFIVTPRFIGRQEPAGTETRSHVFY